MLGNNRSKGWIDHSPYMWLNLLFVVFQLLYIYIHVAIATIDEHFLVKMDFK